MSEWETPETDAMVEQSFHRINFPTSPVPAEFAKRLENERDAERALAEMFRRKCSRLALEHKALQEQLDAAIMLGKMQERRHERDLEELIAAAKAVIDRWETPFWKEAAYTGAYIAALRKAVEIAEGGHL